MNDRPEIMLTNTAGELPRKKCRHREVLTLDDFTEADIQALEEVRAPESSKAFDAEMH